MTQQEVTDEIAKKWRYILRYLIFIFTISPHIKDEVPPILTYCPLSIMTTRTEYWGVQESFSYPSAEDNYDMELQVNVDPPDLKSPYNFTSDTTCTYTFTDDDGNSVSCVFHVYISNEVQPVINFCPPGRELTTNERVSLIDWEKPSYVDMPGIDLETSCNTLQSPAELPWGDHDIICHVKDPDSGLQTECRMSFRIRPAPCQALRSPAHGALACDTFAFGRYCTVFCQEDYDVPRVRSRSGRVSTITLFVCGNSGSWYPQHNVPNCAETTNRRHNLPLIMYYPSACSHDDLASIEAIASKFLQIIQQSNFQVICANHHMCSVSNVNVSCGSSDRKRRSVTDEVIESASETEPNLKVNMVLQVSPLSKGSDVDDTVRENPRAVLHSLAHHIHSHIQRYLSDQGVTDTPLKSGEDVLAQQQFISKASLLFGDVSVECKPGHYLDEEMLACVPCPAGYYLDVTSDTCTPCEQGFYQDNQAQTDCKRCRNGTSTHDQGATHSYLCEVLCDPGQFSSTGFSPCWRCEKGSYQPLHGQTRCESCPSGLTTPAHSATSREQCQEPCSPGGFSANGFYPCDQCPFGSYQPHPQSTSCRQCPDNATTVVTGATSIKHCQYKK